MLNILNHPIGKRILHGSFWSLFGTAIGKFFILLSSIFCARILGDYDYGELGIVRSTIAMFIVVGAAGIGVTASKYISQYRANNEIDNIISIINITRVFTLILGAIIVLLICLFSDYIAKESFNAPELSTDLKYGAILLFFSVFNAYQNGVLSGFENFKAIGVNTLIAGIFEFLFIVMGAYLYSVSGAIIGYGISFIILSLLNAKSISRTSQEYTITKSPYFYKKDHFSILWRFALPAALNAIIVTASFWIIKTMLVRSSGFGELGVYEAADQWKVIMLYIPSALSTILLPILSNVAGSGNSTKKLIKYNLVANTLFSTLVALIVFLLSKFIMSLYGAGFEDPYPLIVLAISTVFTTIALVTTTAMTSYAKVWTNFVFQLIWSAAMIISALFFLHKGFGALGLSLAILVAYVILATVQTIYFFCSKIL